MPFILRRAARAFAPVAGHTLAAALFALFAGPAAADTAYVVVDGRTQPLPAHAESVRTGLAAAGVVLGPDDQVTPPLDAPLPEEGSVRVVRVSWTEESEEVRLPFRTAVRPSPSAPRHPTVMRPGRPGLKQVTYRVRRVDGHEVERVVLRETVLREPETQLVLSRHALPLASRGAYAGRRTLNVVATAYDPGPGSCGRYADGRTCNGKRAGYGVIAVDPKVIPLGAKLHVPGYGYGIAADVGSAIRGQRVDLGFNSRAGARQWGRKRVTLTVVD